MSYVVIRVLTKDHIILERLMLDNLVMKLKMKDLKLPFLYSTKNLMISKIQKIKFRIYEEKTKNWKMN